MTELFVILISTVLVNNFVLVRFLGLCPFLGVSRNLEAAMGMSLATAFVLTLSSATAYLLHQYVLVPLDLEYLRTIGFILVIAASVQFTEIMVRRMSPLLDQVLGIYIPLDRDQLCRARRGIAQRAAIQRLRAICLLRLRRVGRVSRWSSSCLPPFANGSKPLTFRHPFGAPPSR